MSFVFKGKRLNCHQVAWFLHHGEWPAQIVDHVNGVRTDNSINNLRLLNARQNAQNMTMHRGGRKPGAHPTGKGKFSSVISYDGMPVRLGTFNTEDEAAAAYQAACMIMEIVDALVAEQALRSRS